MATRLTITDKFHLLAILRGENDNECEAKLKAAGELRA